MTVMPTHKNLRRDWDGSVHDDGRHDHQFTNATPLGLILPVAGTSRWVWISDAAPEKARLADSEEHAKKALIAHVLKAEGVR